jgi:5-methylcytosine-specific restriction endonuclease McrA
MCGKPLPKRRYNWCSDLCLAEFRALNGIAINHYVYQRDKGVCYKCGLDTHVILEICSVLMYPRTLQCSTPQLQRRFYKVANEIRDGWSKDNCISFWRKVGIELTDNLNASDAHHIVPFSESGDHSSSNLITLCIACHKEETRKFHAARSKKGVKEQPQLRLL